MAYAALGEVDSDDTRNLGLIKTNLYGRPAGRSALLEVVLLVARLARELMLLEKRPRLRVDVGREPVVVVVVVGDFVQLGREAALGVRVARRADDAQGEERVAHTDEEGDGDFALGLVEHVEILLLHRTGRGG